MESLISLYDYLRIKVYRFLLLILSYKDRHIVGTTVLIDQHQDWNLLEFKQAQNFTIFKFRRPMILCNSEDRSIEVIK
jgi:hypothetical protein